MSKIIDSKQVQKKGSWNQYKQRPLSSRLHLQSELLHKRLFLQSKGVGKVDPLYEIIDDETLVEGANGRWDVRIKPLSLVSCKEGAEVSCAPSLWSLSFFGLGIRGCWRGSLRQQQLYCNSGVPLDTDSLYFNLQPHSWQECVSLSQTPFILNWGSVWKGFRSFIPITTHSCKRKCSSLLLGLIQQQPVTLPFILMGHNSKQPELCLFIEFHFTVDKEGKKLIQQIPKEVLFATAKGADRQTVRIAAFKDSTIQNVQLLAKTHNEMHKQKFIGKMVHCEWEIKYTLGIPSYLFIDYDADEGFQGLTSPSHQEPLLTFQLDWDAVQLVHDNQQYDQQCRKCGYPPRNCARKSHRLKAGQRIGILFKIYVGSHQKKNSFTLCIIHNGVETKTIGVKCNFKQPPLHSVIERYFIQGGNNGKPRSLVMQGYSKIQSFSDKAVVRGNPPIVLLSDQLQSSQQIFLKCEEQFQLNIIHMLSGSALCIVRGQFFRFRVPIPQGMCRKQSVSQKEYTTQNEWKTTINGGKGIHQIVLHSLCPDVYIDGSSYRNCLGAKLCVVGQQTNGEVILNAFSLQGRLLLQYLIEYDVRQDQPNQWQLLLSNNGNTTISVRNPYLQSCQIRLKSSNFKCQEWIEKQSWKLDINEEMEIEIPLSQGRVIVYDERKQTIRKFIVKMRPTSIDQ